MHDCSCKHGGKGYSALLEMVESFLNLDRDTQREILSKALESGDKEPFVLSMEAASVTHSSPSPPSQSSAKGMLPPELQIQIISHLAEASVGQCGFCYLFSLSTASRVNRLWNYYGMKALYTDIPLNFSARYTCAAHNKLSSNHVQLGRRIPLLVRTLESRPDLAQRIRGIQFPHDPLQRSQVNRGELAYWVTCALEKKWLPTLIRLCGNLESVDGLQDVLRDLFNGDHFCMDNTHGQEHGYLAQALIEKTTLKRWDWARGSFRKLEEQVVGDYDSFASLHQHWENLEHLGVLGIDGLTPAILDETISKLSALRSLALGLGTKRAAQRDSLTSLLSVVPPTLDEVTIVGHANQEILEGVMEWVHDLIEFRVDGRDGTSPFPAARTKEDILLQHPPAHSSNTTKVAMFVPAGVLGTCEEAYYEHPFSRHSRVFSRPSGEVRKDGVELMEVSFYI